MPQTDLCSSKKFDGWILLCAVQVDRWISHVRALSDTIRHRALVIVPPSQLLTITAHHHIHITPPSQGLAITTHHHIQLLRAQSVFSVALALWFRPQPPEHSKYILCPVSICNTPGSLHWVGSWYRTGYHQGLLLPPITNLNLSFQFIVDHNDHLGKPGCKLYGSFCVVWLHVCTIM